MELAKQLSVAIGIVAAIGAVWTRFIVVEQRQEAQLQEIVSLRQDIQRLDSRVLSLERDRVLLERVHSLELQVGTIKDRLETMRHQR